MAKKEIDVQERELLFRCLDKALGNGASAARMSISKSLQRSFSFIGSELDKVCCSADRGLAMTIYAGGRYGNYHTNRLEEEQLDSFISRAVQTTLLMEEDPCRKLPLKCRKAVGCACGDELENFDVGYPGIEDDKVVKRIGECLKAEIASVEETMKKSGLCSVASVESQYDDEFDDFLMIDTDGFEGRQKESSYSMSCEATVLDDKGDRYSSFWWDGNAFHDRLKTEGICTKAFERAMARISPRTFRGGNMNIIVDNCCSSKLLNPILSALDGFSLYNGNSFLADSLGKRIFHPSLSITDRATSKGVAGVRLFDGEGVAVRDSIIVEKGVVKEYFVNTYISGKSGMEATVDSPTRPCIEPWLYGCDKKDIGLEDIMTMCGEALYITGFNGGNCNQTTGNFSFGAEGFAVRNGRIAFPVKEVLITGNMTELWNKLLAAGSDARECCSRKIPTLAFSGVSVST